MMKLPFLLLLFLGFLLPACATSKPATPPPKDTNATEDAIGVGMLAFVANGEDFVRQGFVAKDGWRIDFDHIFVTVAEVTAYQTDPPYDAVSGIVPVGASVNVVGPLTIDLAAGDENAEPLLIKTVEAAAGQYNALGWRMAPASDGETAGATISLIGAAQKDGAVVQFTIKDSAEYAYNCGEFVGDGRKGILTGGGTTDIEATFHFDHIFGNADMPADDALNVGAVGFDVLAALAEGGALDTTVADLESQLDAEVHGALVSALATLGHVGEGHCYEAAGGYTGHSQ